MGKIMYGPMLSAGRERLIERCAQMIDSREGQFVYLVPTPQLQREVEEALVRRIRDGRCSAVGMTGVIALPQPQIYRFDGFVSAMLKDWLAYQKPIREDQQKLILKEVTQDLRAAGELPFLHGVAEYEGFYVSLLQWLEEVKGTGQTPANWLARTTLSPKERELGLIYERYEEFLTARGLVDKERNYERLIELINSYNNHVRDLNSDTTSKCSPESRVVFAENSRQLDQHSGNVHGESDITLRVGSVAEEDADPARRTDDFLQGLGISTDMESGMLAHTNLIVIDGFHKLTQLQLRLVKTLLGCGKEVIVHTFVEEERSDLFASSQEMIEHLQVMAAQAGASLELEAQEAVAQTGRAEVLNHLCVNMFNLSPRQVPGSEAVEVVYSPDPYQEMEEVGRSIKRALLAEGNRLRLDEFAVILRNVEAYHFYINEVFGELGIPYEISMGTQLARTPIFKLMLKLYRVIAENWSRESVLEVVKSHYLNFGDVKVVEGYEHLILEAGVIGGHADWPRKLGRLERRLLRELEVSGGGMELSTGVRANGAAGPSDRDSSEKVECPNDGQQHSGGSQHISWLHSAGNVSTVDDDDLVFEVEPGKKDPVKIQAKLASLADLQTMLGQFFGWLTRLSKSQSLDEHGRALLEFFAAYELDKQVLKTRDHEILRRDLLTLEHLHKLLDEMIRFGAILESGLDTPGRQRILDGCAQSTEISLHCAESARPNGGSRAKSGEGKGNRLTPAEFVGYLQESASACTLPEPEAKYDAVQILTPSQSRGYRFKRVYIGGLVEGQFPYYGQKDWLFKPEERRALKDQGIHFKQFYEQLEEERLFFLEAACTAAEKLVLTCPVLPGSEDAHSSSFIQEVLNLLDEETIRCQVAISRRVRSFAELEQALTRRELDENLLKEMWENPALDEVAALEYIAAATEGLRSVNNGTRSYNGVKSTFKESSNPRAANVDVSAGNCAEIAAGAATATSSAPVVRMSSEDWLHDLYLRGEMVKLREGATYSQFDGVLQEQAIIDKLQRTYHSNKVYSISQINDYAICPFQFFGKRVLRLDQVEEPTMRLEALDLGNLYHKVLFLFFRDFPGWEEETLDAAQVRMREVADGVMENYLPGLTLPPGLWAIYQEEVREVLGRIISFEYAEAAKQGYQLKPNMLEASFGLMKDYQEEGTVNFPEPVVVQRTLTDGPDGTITVKFHGKIDRIDMSADGRYVIIYDYKFGRRDGLDDIEAGVDLQLPIYVKAAQYLCGAEAEVLGAGYFSLVKCERKSGIWRDTRDDLVPVTTRSKNCLSTEDWQATLQQADQFVIEYIQQIKAGDFKVNPAKCPEYCKFKKICRFEHARNQRKVQAKEVVGDGN